MEEALVQHARDYAEKHQLGLTERLGFGIHGIIFVAENKVNVGRTAVKAHRTEEPYRRERDAYQRLQAARVTEVLGFQVPQLVRFDDRLLVVEMSIVVRPFVLDFAGAWLDIPPEFPDERWAEWEAEKQAQFGGRWHKVQEILGTLEELDIHMIDVSPSNIAFSD
jgi:hypothetical protein